MDIKQFEDIKREILSYDGRHPWDTKQREIDALKEAVLLIFKYLEEMEEVNEK